MAEVTTGYVNKLRREWDNLTNAFTAAYTECLTTKALLGADDPKETLKDVKSLADFAKLQAAVGDTTDIAKGKLDKGAPITRDTSSPGTKMEIKTMRVALDYLNKRVERITVTHVHKTIYVDKDPKTYDKWKWIDPSIRGKTASQYNFQIGITGLSISAFGVLASVTGAFAAVTGYTWRSEMGCAPLDMKKMRLSAMVNTLEAIANEVEASQNYTETTTNEFGALETSVSQIERGSGAQINA